MLSQIHMFSISSQEQHHLGFVCQSGHSVCSLQPIDKSARLSADGNQFIRSFRIRPVLSKSKTRLDDLCIDQSTSYKVELLCLIDQHLALISLVTRIELCCGEGVTEVCKRRYVKSDK